MKKSRWNRSLGTSKQEQGIKTPKAPHNRGHRKFTHYKIRGRKELAQDQTGLDRLIAGLIRRENKQKGRDFLKNRYGGQK